MEWGGGASGSEFPDGGASGLDEFAVDVNGFCGVFEDPKADGGCVVDADPNTEVGWLIRGFVLPPNAEVLEVWGLLDVVLPNTDPVG